MSGGAGLSTMLCLASGAALGLWLARRLVAGLPRAERPERLRVMSRRELRAAAGRGDVPWPVVLHMLKLGFRIAKCRRVQGNRYEMVVGKRGRGSATIRFDYNNPEGDEAMRGLIGQELAGRDGA